MARPRLTTLAALALALCVAALGASPASAALDAEQMFEPTTVVAIDLELPPASKAALEADPDEYVEGTFALAETDGTPAGIGPLSAPITVGIRLKGGIGSFRDLSEKAAFKVKFNEFVKGQKFLGLKKLTLNNMVQDPSMIHEALAYDAFRAVGVHAPHVGYAYVHLNGVDYGLHLNVETLDDVALEKRFGELEDEQHLYEGRYGTDVLPGSAGAFEVDEGDEDDRSDLEALIAAAAATDADFTTRMEPVAELGEMVRMWAAERYLGQWDGYTGPGVNNYYLLSDPAGKFQMLPWGLDQTLSEVAYPFTGQGGTLFEQCLEAEVCEAAYLQALADARETTAALELGPRAAELAALLGPWQERELTESERAPHDAAAIAAAVEATRAFLAERPAVLTHWLATGELPGGAESPAQPSGEESAAGPGDHPHVVKASGSASLRLEADRVALGRGVLITRVAAPGPGTIRQTATILTAEGPVVACASKRTASGPGAVAVHCRLADRVRDRLRARWLTLRLRLRFQPTAGAGHLVSRAVVIPRQAR